MVLPLFIFSAKHRPSILLDSEEKTALWIFILVPWAIQYKEGGIKTRFHLLIVLSTGVFVVHIEKS